MNAIDNMYLRFWLGNLQLISAALVSILVVFDYVKKYRKKVSKASIVFLSTMLFFIVFFLVGIITGIMHTFLSHIMSFDNHCYTINTFSGVYDICDSEYETYYKFYHFLDFYFYINIIVSCLLSTLKKHVKSGKNWLETEMILCYA